MSAARAKQPLPDRVDVAIVGAGLGGLSAGAYLARHGMRVAIFDGHYVAGGCCTQFARGSRTTGKYRFDIGLHYIGDCRPGGMIPTTLEQVGIDDIDYLELDPDGFDIFSFPDFQFRVPANLELYRERLVGLFPSERRGIDRFCRLIAEVDHIGHDLERRHGKRGLGFFWEIARKGRLVAQYQNATIAQFLDSCTKDIKLRAVMLGQHGDYGLPPSEASAVVHAGLVGHYICGGAFYPRGGGQVIADRLAETIEAAGGTVHLRQPIERVLIEGGRAVGVRTEAKRRGESHDVRASHVISNADIKATLQHLVGPEHLPSKWVKRADDFDMAAAIFMTCLGVETDMAARGMTSGNVWQFDGYDFEAFYRDGRAAGAPRPRGAYITSASFKDPDSHDHAPSGVTSVEVMTIVPGDPKVWGVTAGDAVTWGYKRSDAYLALKHQLEEDLIRRLDTVFPGSAEHVVFRESASPVTHTRYTRASDGTGYGIACTPDQTLERRPGFRTPIPGLYLCGASTRAGHGVVGALMSGHHVAHCLGRDIGRPIPESGPTAVTHSAPAQPKSERSAA